VKPRNKKNNFGKMNKAELVDAIATGTGLTKTKSAEVVESFVESITGALKKGDKVTLVGFGTFSTSKRKARKGRNPKTGAVINIAGKTVAKFKAGSELSKSVN
jgi:DNA-binding protein HU-beta